jgi:hypothetical protein
MKLIMEGLLSRDKARVYVASIVSVLSLKDRSVDIAPREQSSCGINQEAPRCGWYI